MTRGRKKKETIITQEPVDDITITQEPVDEVTGDVKIDAVSEDVPEIGDVRIDNVAETISDGSPVVTVPETEPVKETTDDDDVCEGSSITNLPNLNMRDDYRDSHIARGILRDKVQVTLLNKVKNNTDILPPVFCITRKNGQKVYFRMNVNSNAVIEAWKLCEGKIDAETFVSWLIDIYKLPAPKYYSDFKLISL